ncbi:MAG: HAMP domain-containing sensor histidine kinase [Candidatus Paceibacterota bacterium]
MEKKSSIKFLQDNRQVFYSIAIMILIPTAVIVNSLLFGQSFREILDVSLWDRGVGIGQSINVALADKLDSPEKMQDFIDNWKNYNDNTRSFDVFYPQDGKFKVVASMDNNRLEEVENYGDYILAWSSENPIAHKIAIKESGSSNTYWLVVTPLKNLQGKTQALLSMRFSATIVESKLVAVLTASFWVLMITVFFIILLLLGNFRLFEYSILYNKIKEVDQMKDEFISMASHELRTPITVIKGYVSMVLEQEQGFSEQTKNDLSVIGNSADRLAVLIEDMLNVSRIEQGRLKIETKETEAWPIIEETVQELKIKADEKKLILSCFLETEAKTMIKIDKDKFKQVLINIIGNSIKYTMTGSVEVKALKRDKNFVVLIKDTGIGMTAKEKEHLFEKFYRVKSKKTEEIMGTGLGLWITKQIVELMNGSIAVDSMEGVGTQVTIEFPLIEEKK